MENKSNLLIKDFPHLNWFSREIGIPAQNLVDAFKVEKEFHFKILNEKNPNIRKELYKNVYQTVHKIYGKSAARESNYNPKDERTLLFKKELEGKSILEVGCGNGDFLFSVEKNLAFKKLVGIDISSNVIPKENTKLKFINSDIIDFELDEQFDVVFSDNVFEHISPMDISSHLNSIKKVLKKDGTLILILPNKLFGPSDVTRIIDYTYSNKVEAMGTHLNESTYSEVISLLIKNNFKLFKTILPLPKIKYMLPNFRINPKLIFFIEHSPFLLNIFYKIKYRKKCLLKFDIILICKF